MYFPPDKIIGYEKMKQLCLLDSEETAFIEGNPGKLHRIGVTGYYASLAGNGRENPLRKQFVPSIKELEILEYEKNDPLCEERFSPSGRIIRRYPDRVLFLATGRCALYCRHCFRRYLGNLSGGDAVREDADTLHRYLVSDRSIREVLISGGDPLMLEDDMLEYLCSGIRKAGRDIAIRIGTRIPVVLPSRIDERLCRMLSRFRPLYVFTQFNHPDEITADSASAVDLLSGSGIPVFNQTVLLKDINNSEMILEELFYRLVSISVKPYYLFQGDLACGTSSFRTNLMEGIDIMEKLRSRMSALSLPLLAVDLPDGGGKALLERGSVIGRENGFFLVRSNEGKVFPYPDE